MNRRTTLKRMLGNSSKNSQPKSDSSMSLSPYTGEWTLQQASHLLRRTTFGATYAQLKQAIADGLETSLQKLFVEQSAPEPPIYFNFEDDPTVDLGETWVNTIENTDIDTLRSKRRHSLFAWSIKNLYDSGETINIREKMTLFWHNHFVTANPNRARRYYQYYSLLRKNALGNFKTFVEEITIDSAMLRYLNGQQNTKTAPNENYSRELLELFTIGKGPAAGPGDYTNYTEQDVVELARALTGWRYNNATGEDANITYFQANRHDEGEKQLSHRFDNMVISNEGENEYKKVIEIIFQKEEVARFISRKLYNWFLDSAITDEVETNIITPMAQKMVADGYEIQPTLMTLLSSEYFYSSTFNGCMVAHPLDFHSKIVNTFQIKIPEDPIEQYLVFFKWYRDIQPLEMNIFYHPTVAGWKAFYQAPQYTKIWINSVSLPVRQKYSDRFIDGYKTSGISLEIDALEFVAGLDNPLEPNKLIQEIASVLFAQPLTEEQLIALKAILLPGLPDYEWTVEYSDYLAGDTSLESSIESKLKTLLKTMLKMPEFYLI